MRNHVSHSGDSSDHQVGGVQQASYVGGSNRSSVIESVQIGNGNLMKCMIMDSAYLEEWTLL